MIFWLICAALTVLAVALLALPLLRHRAAPDPADAGPTGREDLEVYRDQLREVERDQARGLLDEEQAAAARLEIERRLLRAAERLEREKGRAAPKKQTGGRALAAAVACLLPLGAVGLYAWLGSPGTPSQPYAQRAAADGATPRGDLRELADNLARRLNAGGGDAQDWILLGRTYAQLDRYAEAAEAARRAVALGAEDAESYGFLGEMLVAANQGQVSQPARNAFAQVMEIEPGNPRALYYGGLAMAQDGRLEEAYNVWVGLAHSSPADAPWMGVLTQQITRIAGELGREPPAALAGRMPQQGQGQPQGQMPAPGQGEAGMAPRGPSAADMAAAQDMTPEERMSFIRSMVDGLAQRLEDNPGDLQGWLRLIRAYQVLGEGEKAEAAIARAEPLVEELPEGAPERQALEAARQALTQGQ